MLFPHALVRPKYLLLALVLAIVGYLCLTMSEVRRLTLGFDQLQLGMSEQQVMTLMADANPDRSPEARLAERLTAVERGQADHTLVFLNSYHVDPAIYCYFDIAGHLVAKRRYD